MSPRGDGYAGGGAARHLLLGATVFLTLFGMLMIFSASSISDVVKQGSSTYHLVKQLGFIAAGLAACVLIAKLDYRQLKARATWIWLAAVGLVGLTFLLGVVRGGAQRWIPLGAVNLQPSEFAKVATVFVVAALAADWQRGKTSDGDFFKRTAIFAGVPAVLIAAQPDLGTAMALVLGVGIVLYLGGIQMRWIFAVMGVAVAGAVVGIMVEPYRMQRVVAFMDPFADPLGKGYQTVQALLAFGTGGITGLGLGMSRQKFFYLPEAHTDFIFAIIGEEIGLIGTLAIVVAFGVLLYAGIRIAVGSRDQFGKLLAGGVTGMLGIQAVMNMMAVTSMMPVTGKPMPFVSYGGSSMIVTLASVGLILSVSKFGAKAPRAVKSTPRPAREKKPREGSHERGRDGGARLSGPRRRKPARKRA